MKKAILVFLGLLVLAGGIYARTLISGPMTNSRFVEFTNLSAETIQVYKAKGFMTFDELFKRTPCAYIRRISTDPQITEVVALTTDDSSLAFTETTLDGSLHDSALLRVVTSLNCSHLLWQTAENRTFLSNRAGSNIREVTAFPNDNSFLSGNGEFLVTFTETQDSAVFKDLKIISLNDQTTVNIPKGFAVAGLNPEIMKLLITKIHD
ncbi:MAG TPA: hypothetical protein VEA59_01290 [Patescibacteria group bacterium]|nr:hypothetical protein [Patescibacteria group bacterium]